MSTDAAVDVRGLVKRYGDLAAVDGLDLEIPRGEVFALLGPNGAGKTTTVEILHGHRSATSGRVAVLGEDPATAPLAWRSRVGVVWQSVAAFDELTVTEVVSHFAAFYPDPRPVAEVVDLVGLTAKAGERIRRLSGGQRRRVDVALGIVGRPELLFLDEPTTGFDPEARRTFWEVVRNLRTGGTTMLLTTHYLEEAEALADRVGVIVAGRLAALGVPGELGGRQQSAARVSWDDPDRGRVVEETATPTAMVAELATRFGGEVPGLTVTRASLEDVYLRLLGEGS